MNIGKINGSNAARIYAETGNKKVTGEKLNKAGEKELGKHGAAHEKFSGVNISREAKNMNVIDFATDRIKADFNKEVSAVSADRISHLKNLVQSGDYRIDTETLVSALITGRE